MKFAERKRLMDKSLLCFGVSSRWKTIMKHGRKQGNRVMPISLQEIEDTMDYILAEREKNLRGIMEKGNANRLEGSDRENSSEERPEQTDDESNTECCVDGSCSCADIRSEEV